MAVLKTIFYGISFCYRSAYRLHVPLLNFFRADRDFIT